MPDDLDRLFERLVRVLAEDAPGRLAVPFPAAEVYERLVPYRSNRSTLKVATHQDYEMAVLRLLSGERGYVSLDPGEVQEALRRETADVNPDPGLFRQFPDAILSLNRLAAERFLRGGRAYAPPNAPLPDAPARLRRPRARDGLRMTVGRSDCRTVGLWIPTQSLSLGETASGRRSSRRRSRCSSAPPRNTASGSSSSASRIPPITISRQGRLCRTTRSVISKTTWTRSSSGPSETRACPGMSTRATASWGSGSGSISTSTSGR